MAIPTIIAYNQTASPVFFDRLGLTVPASSSLVLTDYAFVEEIREDETVHAAILADEILLGFGHGESTKGESLKFFNIVTQEVRPPVKALADSDVASLSGATTIDGVSVVADDRVLLTAQSTASENGIWVVKAGAWERPDDFDIDQSASGALVTIQNEIGSSYGGQTWICNTVSGSDIIDTDSLTFEISSGGAISLQEAYEAGNTITTSTAEGSVAITTTVDDAHNAFTVTSGAHTVSTGGNLITATTTANASGNAISITNAGTGTGIFENNTGTGSALDIQDSGTSVLLINGSGAVSVTPTSGQNATITSAGAGVVDINSGSGGIDLDATAGNISLATNTSGNIELASAGTVDVQATGAVTIDSSGSTIGIGTDSNDGAINIGTASATGRDITIGNATGDSSVVVNAGTGEILLNAGTTINGNLNVLGTTTSIDSVVVNIADNYLYLNKDYTTASGKTGGLVVNYLPTATADAADTGGFATTSTVITVGSATFAAGDIIQISNSDNAANDGLYEVLTHTGTTLTIDTTPQEDFSQTGFTVDAGDVNAVITKVGVSVIRQDGAGDWEVASGNTVPLTYSPLALVSDITLQQAYVGGNTITTSGAEGNVTITGTEDLIVTTSDVDIDVSGTVSIDATSSISIGGDADTSSISIGTGAAARTITVGNTTGATGVVINSGTEQVEVNGVTYYGVSAGNPTATTSGFQAGDKYYDSTLDMEMRYDGTTWLSVESCMFTFGRDGNIPTGVYFRGPDGRIMSDTIGYVSPFAGQVVAVGFTRSDNDTVIFEVTADGVTIESTTGTAATSYYETNSTGTFVAGDILAVRNSATGSNTASDVVGWFKVKWTA